MKKKLVATLATAAVLALAPLCVNGMAITASASSNDTAEEEIEEEVYTYADYVADVENEIAGVSEYAAEAGTTTTYEIYDDSANGFTMSNSLMQSLVDAGNVDFVAHFTYNGVAYTITIPAGQAVDNTIPYYGPLYLIQYYGSSTVSATTAASSTASGSVYTVQSGDTLSVIAADNGLTLSELVALNPQITNINVIHPGQSINLK